MYATAEFEVPRSMPMRNSLMVAVGAVYDRPYRRKEGILMRAIRALLFFSTNIELQLPTAGAALLQTAKFQSADFSHRCLQIHRNELAGFAGLPSQGRFNGHDFFE